MRVCDLVSLFMFMRVSVVSVVSAVRSASNSEGVLYDFTPPGRGKETGRESERARDT